MIVFLWNILIAIGGAVLTGQFTPLNLLLGFLLGYFLLWFANPWLWRSRYHSKVRQVFGFLLYFLGELILANLRLAYEVATPNYNMRPGVVAIPLEARSDAEITVLANCITLTPGTLSLDVSQDRKTLYIHAMFIHDLEEFRREIKTGMERRVLEVLR